MKKHLIESVDNSELLKEQDKVEGIFNVIWTQNVVIVKVSKELIWAKSTGQKHNNKNINTLSNPSIVTCPLLRRFSLLG